MSDYNANSFYLCLVSGYLCVFVLQTDSLPCELVVKIVLAKRCAVQCDVDVDVSLNGIMMWTVLALLTLGGGLAAGQDWLPDLTDNLRDPSVLYMPEVNYSEPVINATYVSKFEFDMRAMGHLYNSTHMIIDFIANKQAYPEGKSQATIIVI